MPGKKFLLGELEKAFPGSEFSKFMKKILEKSTTKEVYSSEAVKKFILLCRRDEGIPTFSTTYDGERFRNSSALARCWAGHEKVGGIMFTNVLVNDLELMERGTGDWKKLIKKYGNLKEIEEANKYLVFVEGYE